VVKKLPVVLSGTEVEAVLAAVESITYRAVLTGNSARWKTDASVEKPIPIRRQSTDPAQECLTRGDRHDLREVWKMSTNQVVVS
jgi:hypothetical protein